MTALNIRMLGNKMCKVIHDTCETILTTTTAREYGGTINEFSSTDLLAAALGTCIATTIEAILIRHSIQLDDVEIIVQKELSKSPKGIKFIAVTVLIKKDVDSKLLKTINKATKTCLVYNSLAFEPQISVEKVR